MIETLFWWTSLWSFGAFVMNSLEKKDCQESFKHTFPIFSCHLDCIHLCWGMGNQLEGQSLCDILNCLSKTAKYVNAAISDSMERHKMSLSNFCQFCETTLGKTKSGYTCWEMLVEQPLGHPGRPDFIIRSPAMLWLLYPQHQTAIILFGFLIFLPACCFR